jgi:hypothetical protein
VNFQTITGSVVFLALAVACEAANPGPAVPGDELSPNATGSISAVTVVSTTPLDGALAVPTNQGVQVFFNAPMNGATLNSNTFTLTSGSPSVAVSGTVVTAQSRATFRPAYTLTGNTTYTATISGDVQSAAGVALGRIEVWTFTTGVGVGPVLPVELGAAGHFAVLARAAVSTVPSSTIVGNLGVSPAAANYLTGFSLHVDSSNVFATSPQVTGRILAADYTTPTPYNLNAATVDMELACADAASRPTNLTDLCGGNIGGLTMTAGVYSWGGGLLVPTDLKLAGGEDDVWIFQVGRDLSLGEGAHVILLGGAQAKNVFWQVAGKISLAPGAHGEGVMLSQTGISLQPGASVNGRLLTQSAVIIDTASVVAPAEL